MAVGVDQTFPGATLEQYDQINEKIGYPPGSAAPTGCLFHWVTKTNDGIRVVDVWETQQAYEKFAQEVIMPNAASVGFAEPPETIFLDVHNYFTAG